MAVFSDVKDPNARLDWSIDWLAQGWLVTGDTVTAMTVTVPAGINLDTTSFTATKTTLWLSGGTSGVEYPVVTHITTAANRQEDRTLILLVLDK